MKPRYWTQGDSFYIENYNAASPFSSFFPALAGENGKPMWVFYTNRGQAISSFGVNNKDGAMLEFLPANKAYQATALLGFRTFVSILGRNSEWIEPFTLQRAGLHQKMIVRPYEIELVDEDPASGLSFQMVSFGVPHERHPLMARSMTVTNRTGKTVQIRLLDGLPRVVPFGMNDWLVKHMSRTIEAFAEVENLSSLVPFFKLKIEPSDRPELNWLHAGFFSFGLFNSNPVPVFIDPQIVFGPDTAFFKPQIDPQSSANAHKDQLTCSLMPSSLFDVRLTLAPHQSRTLTSYYGFAEAADQALHFSTHVKDDPTYFETKRAEMKKVYEDLVSHFDFKTGNSNLNMYARATFMDNVLRGGYPVSLGADGPLLHLYSRKHGDMERDYNAFQISATYYSQGNGNFRDVNQNRRHDLYFNPQVEASNVEFFFNLLQLDGYNPLVINPNRFVIPKDILGHPGLKNTEDSKREFLQLKREPVLAGQIYEFVSRYALDFLNVNNIFREIIRECLPQIRVQHGEGFWIDHWMYNLDHLDQYLAVFPDKKSWLLFEKNDFIFHDTDHFVRPRREKYIVTPGGHLRQYGAVVVNSQKQALLSSRTINPHMVRIDNGQGEILKTNLFTKLLSLIVVKISSLDPFGVGIEMEADKPGWCDALNGLPGLFGSSTHEMFELHRLVKFMLHEALPVIPHKTIEIPTEIYSFLRDVEQALLDSHIADFRPVWDRLATAREEFREKTFFGVSGKTRAIRSVELKRFLEKASATLTIAEKKAIDPQTKLPTSYFTYSVDSKDLTSSWRQYLYKLNWTQHRIVSFLEGSVHALKSMPLLKAKLLYRTIKKSDLYDNKLGMYKLNASLAGESTEIGRIRVFSPGWLENESIFLHMHYKYLLELLKSGLVGEFFEEFKQGIVSNRDPKTYGRPIFENSSFIASSSFPDSSFHGKGFVARLSGATSEFLGMVFLLFFGSRPFKYADGQVTFAPDPSLPGEWFTKVDELGSPKHSVTLKLFNVPVTYINPSGKSSIGPNGVKPTSYEWILDGRFHNHEGRTMPTDVTNAFRQGRLESLTIHLSKTNKKK